MVEACVDVDEASIKSLEPLVELAGTHLGKENCETRPSSSWDWDRSTSTPLRKKTVGFGIQDQL